MNRSLARTFSLSCGSLVPTSLKAIFLGQFWLRLLAYSCPYRCPGIWSSHTEFPALCPVLHWCLTQAYSLSHSLLPISVEVAASGLSWQRSLAQTCPIKVLVSRLLCLKLLAQTCSCGGSCLKPILIDVTGSGLLHQRSLAQACCRRCPWFGPASMEDPILDLVAQRSLTWACSFRGP